MQHKNKIFLAIDANSLLHRAYHAYPLSLVTAEGEPVNAVYGFTTMLIDVLLKLKPYYVITAFDTKAPTFRHIEYSGYKANRPQTDSDLVKQIQKAKEVLKALNIPILEMAGFEADDILGTIAKMVENNSEVEKVFILTGDRDLFQLVNNKINVLIPKGSFKNLLTITPKEVKATLGVTPEQVVDLKALMGDASDNIPGVKGIGPKTAQNLLTQFNTIENIYKNLDKVNKPRTLHLLKESHQSAIVSKKLARIKKDVPIVFDIGSAVLTDFDADNALTLFRRMQFKSLENKLLKLIELYGIPFSVSKVNDADKSFIEEELDKILTFIKAKSLISTELTITDFTTEINNIFTSSEKNISLTQLIKKIKTGTGKRIAQELIIYINPNKIFTFELDRLKLTIKNNPSFLFWNWWQFVNDLQAQDINIDFLNTKKDLKVLDLQILMYTLSTGMKTFSIEETINTFWGNINMSSIGVNEKLKFLFISFFKALEKLVEIYEHGKDPLKLISEIDPYALVGIALMHKNGIGIDIDKVEEYASFLEKELQELEKKVHQAVGFTFNIRSPQQLGSVLFEQLKLPAKKKNKTGYVTNVAVLEELRGVHPAIEPLLEYRKLQKLYSTYVKPFLGLSKTEDGTQSSQITLLQTKRFIRIHSTFDPFRTSTGRLASSNPNLQNLPTRTEAGQKIREFFVPESGNVFVSFDYSQIDLRVLAHLSGDENLIKAFIEGRDIHRETAAKIFKKDYEDISKEERRIAKTINFGLVYGMGVYGLANRLGILPEQSRKFIDAYFNEFKGVKEYIEKTKEFVTKHHFVLSLLGRRRYIYGVTSNNKMRQAGALREAINMPIQGGSDDIIRSAISDIVQLEEILTCEAKLVLQVHDELVFEIPNQKKYTNDWTRKIQSIMQDTVKLKVPLKVEYTIEDSLGEK